ncbi:MAG: alpha/beta fold hydrolase [Parachlamydiales bacterium]|nr:alpha/beta fold hydrolase [Parachlamydiales bacterium]
MLSFIARNVILPGQGVSRYYRKELDEARGALLESGAKEVTLETKDKTALNGIYISKDKSLIDYFKKRQLFVYFSGNAGCYEFLGMAKENIKQIQDLGFDILVFNYRGVAKSKGSPTPKNLVSDAKEIIKYAKDELKFKDKDIFVMGQSLGGAIATKAVAESKEKVYLIADRTFSSLKNVIRSFKIPSIFIRFLIFLLDFANWDIDITEDWKKIKDRKCMIYAPNDEIIEKKASLYSTIEGSDEEKRVLKLPKFFRHNDFLQEKHLRQVDKLLD